MTSFFVGFGLGTLVTMVVAFFVIRNNRKEFTDLMNAATAKINMLQGK
ncbi:hypothetical protein KAR91_34510 [Candidatus Pacearchaeota archaeon]|nr:hypothetical protein [Candidatus Pacearchaeota archaeon]